MILALFTKLFDSAPRGGTSTWPDDSTRRPEPALFLPFIAQSPITWMCCGSDARTDFRLETRRREDVAGARDEAQIACSTRLAQDDRQCACKARDIAIKAAMTALRFVAWCRPLQLRRTL